MKNAAIGLIVLGLVSLGLSFAWPSLSPKPTVMDDEQGERFMEAVGDAHGARAEEGNQIDAETQKIINEGNEAVENAQRTEAIGTKVFRYTGVLAALAGAGLFFWASQNED